MKISPLLFLFILLSSFNSYAQEEVFVQKTLDIPTNNSVNNRISNNPKFEEFCQKVLVELEVINDLNNEAYQTWNRLLQSYEQNLESLLEDIKEDDLNSQNKELFNKFYHKVENFLKTSSLDVVPELNLDTKELFPILHPLFTQILINQLAQLEFYSSSQYGSIYNGSFREAESQSIKEKLKNPLAYKSLMLLALSSRRSVFRFGLWPKSAFVFLNILAYVSIDLRNIDLRNFRPTPQQAQLAQLKIIECLVKYKNWHNSPEAIELSGKYFNDLKTAKLEDFNRLKEEYNHAKELAQKIYANTLRLEYARYYKTLEDYQNPSNPSITDPIQWAINELCAALLPFKTVSLDLQFIIPEKRMDVIRKLRKIHILYSQE